MSRLKPSGRCFFEGNLDALVFTRSLSRREILDLSEEYKGSPVPLVAFQVDNLNNVENYFFKGSWVKPKKSVTLADGIKLVSDHLGLGVTMNRMVLDCISFGSFRE